MIKVQRFVNQLLSSNCFVVYDDESKKAVVIDPGSEKSEKEIYFIEKEGLFLDYIVLTHEHTDHCYGVNSLKKRYCNSKVVFSEECCNYIKKANRIFFQFYFDSLERLDEIVPSPDVIIHSKTDSIQWGNYIIHFILTPGHSKGSMCISLGEMLFTGDTVLQYPPVFCGIGCDKNEWKKSVQIVLSEFHDMVKVYPGHGEPFRLKDYKQ